MTTTFPIHPLLVESEPTKQTNRIEMNDTVYGFIVVFS